MIHPSRVVTNEAPQGSILVLPECNIFVTGLGEMKFTLIQSVDDTKVVHGSLGHGLEGPIQTRGMEQQKLLYMGWKNALQLHRLRLTGWGAALLKRTWGLSR